MSSPPELVQGSRPPNLLAVRQGDASPGDPIQMLAHNEKNRLELEKEELRMSRDNKIAQQVAITAEIENRELALRNATTAIDASTAIARESHQTLSCIVEEVVNARARKESFEEEYITAAATLGIAIQEARQQLRHIEEQPNCTSFPSPLLRDYATAVIHLQDVQQQQRNVERSLSIVEERTRVECTIQNTAQQDLSRLRAQLEEVLDMVAHLNAQIHVNSVSTSTLEKRIKRARAAVRWKHAMSEGFFIPTMSNIASTIVEYNRHFLFLAKHLAKNEGFTIEECTQAGFTIEECTRAGFTADEYRACCSRTQET